jgi:hypothetical protein
MMSVRCACMSKIRFSTTTSSAQRVDAGCNTVHVEYLSRYDCVRVQIHMKCCCTQRSSRHAHHCLSHRRSPLLHTHAPNVAHCRRHPELICRVYSLWKPHCELVRHVTCPCVSRHPTTTGEGGEIHPGMHYISRPRVMLPYKPCLHIQHLF